MKKIEPYPIASAIFFILEIFYIICMLGKFVLTQVGIDGFWHMHKLWENIIPGFERQDLLSYLIGFIIVGLGSYLSIYIIVPIYNFLVEKRSTSITSEYKPFFLRFKILFFSIFTYVFVLFTICILYDLIVPQYLNMSYLWHLLLPGFRELAWDSYLIGVFDIIVYSFYSSSIVAGIFNYFEKTQIVNER